jgi:hypothetical protein
MADCFVFCPGGTWANSRGQARPPCGRAQPPVCEPVLLLRPGRRQGRRNQEAKMGSTYASLSYHFVWGTKERRNFIQPEFESRLHAWLGGAVRQLVWCLTNDWCYAARDFVLPLGASDEHTLHGSVRSEQRRGRTKELRPEGLRRKWPGASLLLSHVSLRICSFVTPRPRPFWVQHNTRHL